MGSSESKEESKVIDSNGQVNNNIVLTESVDIKNLEIVVLLYIICIVKFLEFIVFVYKCHQKHIKKKYRNQQDRT